MPFKTDIYQQAQGPDVLGSVERGLRMSDFIAQRQNQRLEQEKQNAIKQAYVVDQAGNINSQATQANLAKIDPRMAQQFGQEQQQQMMQQMDFAQKKISTGSQLLSNANAINWSQTKAQLKGLGLDVNDMPDVYNEQYKQTHISQAEQLKQQIEQAKLAQTKAETAKTWAEVNKTKSEMGGIKLTEGEKAVDKDYSKDYNDWNSSGKTVLNKNLELLRQAKSSLEKDPSLSGGFTGVASDRFTADKVLKQRQKVGSAVMNSLKATLGSQFTEKEGERILKNSYNEAASSDTNIESLDAIINQLEQQAANNDAKARYFEQNKGTLKGYKSQPEVSDWEVK